MRAGTGYAATTASMSAPAAVVASTSGRLPGRRGSRVAVKVGDDPERWVCALCARDAVGGGPTTHAATRDRLGQITPTRLTDGLSAIIF